ncbi:MAG TPA: (2Fe-2S) ferredoxin domain-containing protein [Thermodesulfobacteriota bacterium]|nr:(2Fe-2S) ferredoxin domain-containing protein [Thermodesulfobacteriota bacterium]
MARLKNIEELKKLRNEAQKDLMVRTQTGTRIVIGMGTCGIAAGAREVMHAVLRELEARKIEAHVETVGCVGMCAQEPLVDIEQAGKSRVRYANITPEHVPRLIEDHLMKGQVIQEWAIGRLDARKIQ